MMQQQAATIGTKNIWGVLMMNQDAAQMIAVASKIYLKQQITPIV